MLFLLIAGGIYYSYSIVEKIGYYSDEPYPTADGRGFFVMRIPDSDKLASHLPPAEIKVEFIYFPSLNSEGEKIGTVTVGYDNVEFYFGVKGGNLYYITSTAQKATKSGSLQSISAFQLKRKFNIIKSGGQMRKSVDMPPGQYVLKNPVNILLIKNGKEIYNYDPLTDSRKLLCNLPEEYDPKAIKILPGNNPDSLIYLISSGGVGMNYYYFSRKTGKTVNLKEITGKHQVGAFVQFETFDDRIINLFPFSDTPLFFFTDNMKLVPEKIGTSVFKLSPDGSRIAFVTFHKKLFLYNFNTKQSRLLYKENRADHMIHKYFWLPSQDEIIVHLTIPTTKASVTADEIIAINPDTGKMRVDVKPCPAYRYGKSKYLQFARKIRDRINKLFKKKILP